VYQLDEISGKKPADIRKIGDIRYPNLDIFSFRDEISATTDFVNTLMIMYKHRPCNPRAYQAPEGPIMRFIRDVTILSITLRICSGCIYFRTMLRLYE
jgi:hypothetical protein